MKDKIDNEAPERETGLSLRIQGINWVKLMRFSQKPRPKDNSCYMKSIRDRIYEQSTPKHDRKPESVNRHNNLDPINRYRMIKILMK